MPDLWKTPPTTRLSQLGPFSSMGAVHVGPALIGRLRLPGYLPQANLTKQCNQMKEHEAKAGSVYLVTYLRPT